MLWLCWLLLVFFSGNDVSVVMEFDGGGVLWLIYFGDFFVVF